MTFEQKVIDYFLEQVPEGCLQRIDGIRSFAPFGDTWLLRWRLNRLVRKGVLKKRSAGSMWPSLDGMPAYGLNKSQ